MIPIKTATVQEDYAWIWQEDEAIDKGRDDWRAEYDAALESCDLARLPLKPGQKPTIFWLRHPTPLLRRVWAGLWQSKTSAVAARMIAAMALVRAEHIGPGMVWEGRDADGYPCVPAVTMDALDSIPELVDGLALAALAETRPS